MKPALLQYVKMNDETNFSKNIAKGDARLPRLRRLVGPAHACIHTHVSSSSNDMCVWRLVEPAHIVSGRRAVALSALSALSVHLLHCFCFECITDNPLNGSVLRDLS